MATVIYGLVDPRDGRVRYVGKTDADPRLRLRDHVYGIKQGRGWRVTNWLEHLLSIDLRPEIAILEEDPLDWAEAERRWIAHYREQYDDLCNISDGGDSPHEYTHPDEVKQRIGDAARARWADPLWRAEQLECIRKGLAHQDAVIKRERALRAMETRRNQACTKSA